MIDAISYQQGTTATKNDCHFLVTGVTVVF